MLSPGSYGAQSVSVRTSAGTSAQSYFASEGRRVRRERNEVRGFQADVPVKSWWTSGHETLLGFNSCHPNERRLLER